MNLGRLAAVAAPIAFVLIWSTGFIGTKYGMPYIEPFTFLTLRMALVVAVHLVIVAFGKVRWPTRSETGHSAVAALFTHGCYLAGVFIAISQGVPAGLTALIPGLQPIVTSTIANRWLGEKVTPVQWLGLVLGLIGVALVLHDHTMIGSGTWFGWAGSFLSLIGISLGTLYQKRYCGGIDWRTGNLVQYAVVLVLFAVIAFAFETGEIRWSLELVLSITWLALVLSVGAVGLMFWVIRRSAVTGFSSMFYLVPAFTALLAFLLFGEKLDAISLSGMAVCALGVFLVSRAAPVVVPRAAPVRGPR